MVLSDKTTDTPSRSVGMFARIQRGSAVATEGLSYTLQKLSQYLPILMYKKGFLVIDMPQFTPETPPTLHSEHLPNGGKGYKLHNRRMYKVYIAAFLLLVLIIFGSFMRHRNVNHKSASPRKAVTPAALDMSRLTAMQALVQTVDQEATKAAGDEYIINQTWAAENTPDGHAISVPGYAFKVSSAGEPGMVISPKNAANVDYVNNPPSPSTGVIYSSIAATLVKTYGFTDHPLPPSAYQETTSLTYLPLNHTLTRGSDTCSVTEDRTYRTLYMTCGNPAIANILASQTQTFAALFAAAQRVSESDLTVGPVSIKGNSTTQSTAPIAASESPGYNLADVLVQHDGGQRMVALYYAKNNTWHFITQATDEWGFKCADVVRNADARKAMYDQICYDFTNIFDQGRGQVRVDSTRKAIGS